MKTKNLTDIQPQSQGPKSITEMTPFELSQIDAWQNRNRGFYDDEDTNEDDVDNCDFNWED